MPKSTRSFDRMIIPAPCDADWDSMIGNDQVRFCEHCRLHVTDLSALTRRNAMEFVARSQGRVCVRFIEKPNGSVLTRTMPEKLYRIHRRVSRLAAGAFTATLSVSSAMGQSPGSTSERSKQRVELVQTGSQPETIIDEFTANVTGTIKHEEDGPGISDATVVLVDRETGEERSVTTSALGQYSFQFLPQAQYLLWARRSGFRTETETVTVPPNTAVNMDIEMYERTMGFGTGGAMAMIMQPEDPLFKAVADNDVENVRNLAALDRHLNGADRRNGMSLLTEAVQRGNLQIVETLLAFGADANVRNGSGRSPLMSLTTTATPELVRDLVSAGGRLNARDNIGASPLMIAAGASPVRVLRELIDAGANVNARDSSGETCLFYAARSNTPAAIILLVESGVEINVRNDDGDTALMAMASDGNFETFRTLLERGAARNLTNEDGRTLLMLAVMNEDPKLAKLLLETDASINAKDQLGTTALMLAAQAGRQDAIIMLLAAGADFDEKDADGETALMKAASTDNLECVQALLRAGADMTQRNEEGKTALALARESEYSEIVKLLESRGAPE